MSDAGRGHRPQVSRPSSPQSMARRRIFAVDDVAPAGTVQNHHTVAPAAHVHPVAVQPPPRPQNTIRPALPRQHRSIVLKRQMVDRAAHYRHQARRQRIRAGLAFAFGSAITTVLVVGGFVLYSRLQPKAPPQTLAAQTARPGTSATADESTVSPAAIASYKVQGPMPQILRIPSLGVVARIYPVAPGINNEPMITSNIFDAGWLKTSALPGTIGATLLNGHAYGPTKSGLFARLSELQVGDNITVERGDGQIVAYKVLRMQQYDADSIDMRAAQTSQIAGKSGLNILTNTSRFNVRTNAYEKRMILFAVQQ